MHPARFFFFGVCFCAIWFSLLQQNKRRDMFNLSMCFCYAGCCVFSFFSSSFISVCVCAWSRFGNNEMCLFGPNKVLNESKWEIYKHSNVCFSSFLFLSTLCPSRSFIHSFGWSFSFFCCANDWLWVNAACWVWFDGSLLVVSSFI